MKKTMLVTAALVSLSAAMVGAQVGGFGLPKETRPKETPAWVDILPDDTDTETYFVGQSEQLDGERAARGDSRQDARQQFAAFLKTQVTSEINRVSRFAKNEEGEGFLNHALGETSTKQLIDGVTKAMKDSAVYTEIYLNADNYKMYKVFSLMKVNKKALDKAIDSYGQDVAKEIAKEVAKPGITPETKNRLAELMNDLKGGLSKKIEVDYAAAGEFDGD